jgi:hypothetical protein
MKRVWISNAKIFQLVWLMISLRVISAGEWFPALSSNVDDDTFHYYSDVWFNSTPFNTQYPNTKNALFESYSTIYVEKVRITMDGTTDKSCGTQCTFTFSLPESYAGRFTLKELVTTDGGIDLKDDRDISWVPLSFIPLHSISRLSFLFSSLKTHRSTPRPTISNSKAPQATITIGEFATSPFHSFTSSPLSYYTHEMAFNYGNYDRSRDRYLVCSYPFQTYDIFSY